ncbi:MAG: hypothetical protein VX583_02825 [Bdellovibrionota bacterium]
MANLRPILEELKSLKQNINSDAIRDLVLSNFNENREKIEAKIKTLAETTKNNPVVSEYVDQILRAELTNQAVSELQTRFPDHDIVKKIVDFRTSMINPEEASSEETTTEPADDKVEATAETSTTETKEAAATSEETPKETVVEKATVETAKEELNDDDFGGLSS